jgi:hypothetical protein
MKSLWYRKYKFIGSNGKLDAFVDDYGNVFTKPTSGQSIIIGVDYCYNENMVQF